MSGIDNKVTITNKLNLIQKILIICQEKVVVAKRDSSATNHYWRKEVIACLYIIQRAIGLEVTLPENSGI